MAALNLPTCATYEVHESVQVETTDNEDHTFCGILFPIQAKHILPVEKIIIRSLAVRGQLGPLTVWVTKVPPHETRAGAIFQPLEEESNNNNTNNNRGRRRSLQAQSDVLTVHAPTYTHRDRRRYYRFRLSPKHWDKIYEKTHAASPRKCDTLDLSACPIVLLPGQVRAIYIHSTTPNDEAIVYDNSARLAGAFAGRFRGATAVAAPTVPTPRYQDSMIIIESGKAHLSPKPFGRSPIWGWGLAWRDHREFVGQLEYGVVFRLWSPMQYPTFGTNFGKAVRALLMMQRREHEGHWHRLPDECIFYILNMCRWDWFDDTTATLLWTSAANKRHRRRLHRLAAAREQQQKQAQKLPAENPAPIETKCNKHRFNEIGVVQHHSTNGMVEGTNHDSDDDDMDNIEDEDDVEEAVIQPENWAHELVRQQIQQQQEEDSDSDDDEDGTNDDGNNNDNDMNDDNEEDNESEWERANGYRADNDSFYCYAASSASSASSQDDSDDEDDDEAMEEHGRNAAASSSGAAAVNGSWFGQSLVRRAQLFRALGGGGGGRGVAHR